MNVGKINKRTLVEWVDFECQRKLFLDLGDGDKNWINPYRNIKITRNRTQRTKLRFGSEFEKRIYGQIRTLPNVVANVGPDGNVNETVLTKEFLLKNDFHEPVILLEHSFRLSDDFWKLFFPKGNTPECGDRLRPDILVFQRLDGTEKIVSEAGTIERVPNNVKRPIGISIFDIKITQEESINKKHFVEILHYITALNFFLKKEGLKDQFFILANENGIFPNKENLSFFTFDQFLEIPLKFRYLDVEPIYREALSTIRNLNMGSPSTIENIPLRIQPACGRCKYLDDCKETLGANEQPKNWRIELIPYLDPSTGEELKEMGIRTVGELKAKINDIKVGDVPKPMYSELPLLKLKVDAILAQQHITASSGDAYTTAIPKYSDFSISFDANLDPINDIVYNIGIFFSIHLGKKSTHAGFLEKTWNKLIHLANQNVSSPDDNIITETVDYLQQWTKTVHKHNLFRATTHLQKLLGDDTIEHSEQILKDGARKFEFKFAYVNEGLEPSKEFLLAKRAIEVFETIISLTSYLEEIVQVETNRHDKTYVSSPVTAAYYWSWEVVSTIESLMERHLERLLFEKEIREKVRRITAWLTPKESQVKNSLIFKKIYDLRVVAETIMGFPAILNYTWHGIAKHYLDHLSIDKKYWKDHFNYMEFNMWHLLLEEEDFQKRYQKFSEMKEQILKKVKILDRLRVQFQKTARSQISWQSSPVKNRAIRVSSLPADLHNISRAWLMFAKLSGTIQEMEADHFKHMFPDFSIAKLMVAQVEIKKKEQITGKRGGITYRYFMEIKGLSTNAKFSVGDMALICPNDLRDSPLTKYWVIRIISMVWNSSNESFEITTDPVSFDLDNIIIEHGLKRPVKWYIYPYSGDFWSRKLESILIERGIGTSWLGELLDWSLQLSIKNLLPPEVTTLDIAEVYLYRPQELGRIKPDTTPAGLKSPLLPLPDPSQEMAILTALWSPLTLIQGPPGTGKSQTIATLINEVISRSSKPVKILVSSFSYQAMHVVLNKLNNSIHPDNSPSAASEVTKVFVRSSSKEPAENALDLVRENKTWKLNGQSKVVTKKKRITDSLPKTFIMFANPQQVVNLYTPIDGKRVFDEGFAFDYIICDEASQMPLDQFLSLLLFIEQIPVRLETLSQLSERGHLLQPNNIRLEFKEELEKFTKLILVGDHFQLPPVQPINPPKRLEPLLGSVFSYFVQIHQIEPIQLKVNYRSNEQIVEYTKALELYDNLQCAQVCKDFKLNGDLDAVKDQEIKFVLDPEKVLCTIVHNSQFDTALSLNEAILTVALVEGYYSMVSPQTKDEEREFWSEKIGIVAPHNAQGRFITRELFGRMKEKSKLSPDELMEQLRNTTFSVEKFQGSDRDFIIGTIGISSRMQLQKEEEFIYELNRFNVLTSRAKRKIVLIASENFLNYIPKRRTAMENAARIRLFADMCKNEETLCFNIGDMKIHTEVKFS